MELTQNQLNTRKGDDDMKREIKFRAFLHAPGGRTLPMKYPDNLTLFEWESEGDYGMDIMQYTGLKDKNGKEIYEGDILRYTYYLAKQTCVGQVIWNDYSLCWSVRSLIDDDLYAYGPDGIGCEVIGNIYETPELLTL